MYALNKEYPGSGRLVTLRWYVGPAVGREELEIHLKNLYVMGEPGRYSLDTFSSLLNRVTDDPAARYVFSQAMSKSVASATNFELARTGFANVMRRTLTAVSSVKERLLCDLLKYNGRSRDQVQPFEL